MKTGYGEYGEWAGVVTLCYGAPCVSYSMFILIRLYEYLAWGVRDGGGRLDFKPGTTTTV